MNKKKQKPTTQVKAQQKKSEQIYAQLKYQHALSTKTYYVGLKQLNKAWFQALDSIHKKV